MNVDEGLFWGFVLMVLIMGILPFIMKGQKWALISFFGFIFGLMVATTLGANGAIEVGYSSNAGVVSNITNSPSLPFTLMALLTILCMFSTVAKAVDKI